MQQHLDRRDFDLVVAKDTVVNIHDTGEFVINLATCCCARGGQHGTSSARRQRI